MCVCIFYIYNIKNNNELNREYFLNPLNVLYLESFQINAAIWSLFAASVTLNGAA